MLCKAKNLLPDSPEKRAAELAIKQAEMVIRHAEVKLADELDYSLCRCIFPPQICLLHDGVEKCPKCGRDSSQKLPHPGFKTLVCI